MYERLQTQVIELRERFGGLPSPVEAQDIWRGIWLEEAHHSTALEGNTLVLRQVEQLLEEGRAVGNKELREYMEVRGYATAADWLYGQGLEPGSWTSGDLVTLTELRHLHALAIGPAWDVAPHPDASPGERPGSFREHDIQPFPGGMKPPPWPEVHGQVSAWIERTRELTRCDPVALPEVLAALHVRFEQIHPFLDGNGRAGRLGLNLLLVRLGYPPAIIYKRDRGRYLTALRRADEHDFGALGELLARAVLDSLYRFIVPAVAGPVRLVPLPALASNAVSADALRVAAARGRLKATRGADGMWRSSRAWVEEYVAGRQRRG
ncbi:MAG: Fic family protein [Actinomycetota bacterium]|nr:Fic family protein [Actinomycetota bacterium]